MLLKDICSMIENYNAINFILEKNKLFYTRVTHELSGHIVFTIYNGKEDRLTDFIVSDIVHIDSTVNAVQKAFSAHGLSAQLSSIACYLHEYAITEERETEITRSVMAVGHDKYETRIITAQFFYDLD